MPLSRKRALLAGAAALVVLVSALAAWFLLSLDGIVAREIERAGSEVTGTRVSVAGVNVTLREASGTIRSLRVSNPAGFSGEAVLDAQSITFALDPASLRRDVLVVDEVVVTKPHLRFEVGRDGRTNLDALAKNAGGAEPSEGPPRKLRIKRFVIAGAAIRADATAAQGKSESIELRDVVLANVGGRDGGSSDEVAAEIVAAVRKEVVRAVAKEGFRRYLSGEGGDVKTKAREKLDGLFRR